ncbi:hypothetical protein VDGE_06493 [Verticillium dahliae]|uniref:Uncharacterized protein n=1 Tax=Verticillium dahliae TaxID=27337 RepID=A0A444S2A8_VERDA|nr:hypothetical protein VDGE_06493 [Verticillium dahliae]
MPGQQKNDIDSKEPPESWDWDAVDGVETSSSKPAVKPMANTARKVQNANTSGSDATPPTNIPPPSVLLSIFPELLALANTSLFKPAASQPTSIKDRIASDPGTIAFLQGYLALAGVAARIIAGRKLRWHRDKFLAQGMAISSAGAKGMRLAGVDRAQTAREDREAADVVDVWKEHVGRLRSAVAAAKSAPGGQQLRVPDLAENMAVTTAKVVPTAPKACLVCGLKRDERVGKVDFDVEDSFAPRQWTLRLGKSHPTAVLCFPPTVFTFFIPPSPRTTPHLLPSHLTSHLLTITRSISNTTSLPPSPSSPSVTHLSAPSSPDTPLTPLLFASSLSQQSLRLAKSTPASNASLPPGRSRQAQATRQSLEPRNSESPAEHHLDCIFVLYLH